MPYETLVALEVSNDESYSRYRAGMTPLLEEVGGSFRYDFRASEVLKAEEQGAFNRVFVIAFPSKDVADAFFADPAYLAVRKEFFEPAVVKVARIASWER
ncbi:MAG: DUF1330 domain-containing protein [Planctomycetes bacterium]|nr:DUF1330 domain-containing protein [Planctomycetota bacterium]